MGDAHQVIVILVFGVAAYVDGGFFLGAHVGDEFLDVVDALVGEADDAAGEIGVAAAEVVGCFLQHEYAGTLLAGGYGSGEGGIARADYHHIVISLQGGVGQGVTSE